MKPDSFFLHVFNLKKARVGLRPDGIVETDVFEEMELEVDDVKEIIDTIAIVGERTRRPQLIVAGPLSGPDLKAMNYLAAAESSPFAIAEAYVIQSLSQKILGRFYLSFNKPARPTRMFGDEESAVKWLMEIAKNEETLSPNPVDSMKEPAPLILETIKTNTMCASLRNDGLIQLTVQPNTNTTVADIKEAVEAIGKVGKGQRFPLLIIAGKDATLGTEAMTFMARPDTDPYSMAEAYLISSISQKLLGNFYLSFNKPDKPTRIFTDKADAENWLKSFLDKK
ncbi:MAG: hypothetical protein ACHQRM_01225 [Bacteroidia bacterium]